MKYSLAFFLFLYLASGNAFALSFEVIGACSEQPLLQAQGEFADRSVGQATIEILERNSIPFQGSEEGIHSIFNTPVGSAAIEIINNREMRAYGWCFAVDGIRPELMPDQVRLMGSEHLRWFYAFSHYKNGEWVSYCEPAHTVRPASLCR